MEKKLYTVSLQIEAGSQQEANLKLQKMISKMAQIKREDDISWKSIFIQIGLGAAQYYLDNRNNTMDKPMSGFFG